MFLRNVPWFTEGAIEHLKSYLETTPNARILEFGSGASTVWLLRHYPQCTVVSRENNATWASAVRDELTESERARLSLEVCGRIRERGSPRSRQPRVYSRRAEGKFDVLLVDGRDRVYCLLNNIQNVEKGLILLDNSERSHYRVGIDLLKDLKRTDYVQHGEDGCGFWYKGWTTTIWEK